MFNFKNTETQKIFFTSDLHIGHRQEFVWKSRGFDSVEEHDESILNNINSIVKDDDILFNLGDLTLNTTIERFEDIILKIKCKNMYMFFGNHPNRHYKNVYIPMVKNILGDKYTPESEIYPLRYKNIIYLNHITELILGGQYVVLCHYPLYSWNHMKDGSWMLHGHEHSAVPEHLPDGKYGKILDVGWDYFKKPLSFNEIEEIMKNKEIVSVGHH